MKVPIAAIYIGKRRRLDYGRAELEDLQRSLAEDGQITPITLRPPNAEDRAQPDFEAQEWVLVAGGRRLFGAVMLGWKEIEAFGREEMDEIKHRTLELNENLKRKSMTWDEEVAALKEITELRRLQNPEITDAAIAKELGMSAANFSKDLQTAHILEKTPNLKGAGSKSAALNAGKLLAEHDARVLRVIGQPGGSAAPSAPYASLESRVRTEEALAYARKLPAHSVDLFLLDGPYGYDYWKGGQKTDAAHGKDEHLSAYDDSPEKAADLYRGLLPELTRVGRETGWLVFFCGKETYDFIEDLAKDCCAQHHAYRHPQHHAQCVEAAGKQTIGKCRWLRPEPFPWIWYRPNSRNQPRFAQLHAKNMAELILVINLGKGRLLKNPCPSVLVHDAEYGTGRVHANQKPIPLYVDLVERFTFSGDSVVDLFFGSGNSLAGAASIGRLAAGCDLNPEMLPFALGTIRRVERPVTKDMIERSLSRYSSGLTRKYDEEEERDEVGVPAAAIAAPRLPAEGRFQAEDAQRVRRQDGSYYFCSYVNYEGFFIGQRHADSEEEAYDRALGAADQLNSMLLLGLILPAEQPRESLWEALEVEDANGE
jgi:ParB/RepB/Spo0J family partition protein